MIEIRPMATEDFIELTETVKSDREKELKQIIDALRCSADCTHNHSMDCNTCKYKFLEEVKSNIPVPANHVENGVEYWLSCDCDRIALDAADAIEQLMKGE